MSRGIIYVMKTVVPGLVKIGKTGLDNFESRMHYLERHGYNNVTGLKRVFAIAVDDYERKESLLGEIFERSRVTNSELFALDVDLVKELLSSFEGDEVYPKTMTKEEIFEDAANAFETKTRNGIVPDGVYRLSRRRKHAGVQVAAEMHVRGGRYVIPKGSSVCMDDGKGLSEGVRQLREASVGQDGTTTADVELRTPSAAASFVHGAASDGWREWIDAEGNSIDVYRKGE